MTDDRPCARWTSLNGTAVAQRINQQGKGRRRLAPARVVETVEVVPLVRTVWRLG